MAEELAPAQPFRAWARFRDGKLSELLTRQRLTVYILPAFFFLLTFSVYWLLGPRDTIFINHVSQANNFLHGRLDLLPELSGYITEPALKDGKMFLQHPPGPALILLPGVALVGLSLNQTLVSVILASMTGTLVYRIVRTQIENIPAQVWLTIFFLFGTIFWFAGANGGVWFFSHTATLLFLFFAIYATLVLKSPFLAGVGLGAAFLCRNSAAMTLPFFLVMFSDRWFTPLREQLRAWVKGDVSAASLAAGLRHLKPVAQIALGAAPFVLFSFWFNFARFDNPLESGYFYGEQVHQEHLQWLYNRGVFHITYIPRHIPVIFEQLPVMIQQAPYIRPSWAGLAIWATSPALVYALYPGVRDRRLIAASAAALGAMVFLIVSRGAARGWGLWGWWGDVDFPLGFHLLPMWTMIVVAVYTGVKMRDRLVIACWAAIIPTTVTLFLFAATGWAQFGYRYALDIYPFLFLLVLKAVGNDIRWHHKLLIVLSVLVNLWGIVWIYQFEPRDFLGLEWVSF